MTVPTTLPKSGLVPARTVPAYHAGVISASAWKPTDLPGCLFWFDAGAIQGQANGDALGTWLDLSGNARHLTAAGNFRPSFKLNQVNGLPGVAFDSVAGNAMKTAAFTPSGTPLTVFAVFSQSDAGTAAQQYVFDGITANKCQVNWYPAGPSQMLMYAGSSNISPTVTMPQGMVRWQFLFAGASSYMLRSGVILAGPANAGTNKLDGFSLGGRGGTSLYASMIMAEIFGYDGIPSDASAANSYLIAKYGVS